MKNRDFIIEMDNGHIQKIKWHDVPDHRIAYNGHHGVPVLGYNSSGYGNNNPFNYYPNGSNYNL